MKNQLQTVFRERSSKASFLMAVANLRHAPPAALQVWRACGGNAEQLASGCQLQDLLRDRQAKISEMISAMNASSAVAKTTGGR